MDTKDKAKPPLDTVRDRALKATIWENEGENGPYVSIDFAKTIENSDGKLRDVRGFTPDEALRISELARRAFNRGQELFREMRQDREPRAAEQPERAARSDAPAEGRRRYGRARAEPRAEQTRSRRNAPDQSY